MCEPVSITLAATAAVSTALTIASTVQNAEAQQEAYEQNKISQAEASVLNLTAHREDVLSKRLEQSAQDEQTARERFEASQLVNKARSTAVATFGERGVSGKSIQAAIDQYRVEEGRYMEASKRKDELSAVSVERNIRASEMGAAVADHNISTPIYKPLDPSLDIGASIARLGGSMAGVAGYYQQTQAAKK